MNPNIDKLTNNQPPPQISSHTRDRANELLSQRIQKIDPNAYDLVKPAYSQEQYPDRFSPQRPEYNPPAQKQNNYVSNQNPRNY